MLTANRLIRLNRQFWCCCVNCTKTASTIHIQHTNMQYMYCRGLEELVLSVYFDKIKLVWKSKVPGCYYRTQLMLPPVKTTWPKDILQHFSPMLNDCGRWHTFLCQFILVRPWKTNGSLLLASYQLLFY